MLTPQEVAGRAFSRATIGGYNMAMVDEFLDLLTEDYTALYNENAILKTKMKVLSDTIEEYRATDDAMRKTLLAAQQMAESMVSEAEKKKAELLEGAEAQARQALEELSRKIADEEYRLKAAKEATAAHVAALKASLAEEVRLLESLSTLSAPAEETKEDPVTAAAQAIEHSLRMAAVTEEQAAAPAPQEEPVSAREEGEKRPVRAGVPADQADREEEFDTTRRFSSLQFGRDYEIR